MSVWQAIVLGIVQGMTEFLPVSSSAHLLVVPWLLGWESPGLAFDAALHLGTLAAVIVYFWRDLVAMARAFPRAMQRPGAILRSDNPADVMPRLSLLIALGTVPGLVAGFLGAETIDAVYHPGGVAPDAVIVVIAAALIALALLLLWAERAARHVRGMDSLTVRDAVIIGLAQAAALIPGVSRSGATITAGLFRGLTRADAARFSFLLGAPIVAAAGAKGLLDTLTSGLDMGQLGVFAVGLMASALAGFAAIWGLLRYLQRASTAVFIIYRIGLGILLLVLVAVR
ncbi:MAG: undecaprenyl-diphosphate phosphatase [Chloroflexi bacterium]|nr:undecaprenyl-diphosphate phosphatase [Chloroflexota bacterium]